MEGATSREALVDRLRAALPNAQVLEAVDGRALSESALERAVVRAKYAPRYPFPLLPAEVGCFLSHRAAWERIVAAADPAGLVAEDDAALDPEVFPRALALAEGLIAPDRIIRFPLRDRETPGETLGETPGGTPADGDVTAFRPRVVGLGTTMQIVGREAAARLLELTRPFDRPVDVFMQMRWLTRLDTVTVWPSGVRSAAGDTGGSAIQRRNSPAEEVRRTWSRGRYRLAVRSLSRRMP